MSCLADARAHVLVRGSWPRLSCCCSHLRAVVLGKLLKQLENAYRLRAPIKLPGDRSMSGYSFKQTYRYTSTFCMIGRAQPSDELRAETRTAGETRGYKVAWKAE